MNGNIVAETKNVIFFMIEIGSRQLYKLYILPLFRNIRHINIQ